MSIKKVAFGAIPIFRMNFNPDKKKNGFKPAPLIDSGAGSERLMSYKLEPTYGIEKGKEEEGELRSPTPKKHFSYLSENL